MTNRLIGIALFVVAIAVGADTVYDIVRAGITQTRLVIVFVCIVIAIRAVWRLRQRPANKS